MAIQCLQYISPLDKIFGSLIAIVSSTALGFPILTIQHGGKRRGAGRKPRIKILPAPASVPQTQQQTPEEFLALVRRETPKWAEVVRRSGAKVD